MKPTFIHLNELYMYISNIFIDPSSFYTQSINILKHLYEKSSHPQIKGGEFYMVHFTDYIIDGKKQMQSAFLKQRRKKPI